MSLKIRKNRAAALPPTCPVGECMVMLGGAWAPNIIWYLSGGPRRFSELKIDIPGISEEKGAIERRIVPTSPPSVEYRLSDLGEEFVPAIHAIVEVGNKLKLRREAKLAEEADRQNVPQAVPAL